MELLNNKRKNVFDRRKVNWFYLFQVVQVYFKRKFQQYVFVIINNLVFASCLCTAAPKNII